MPVRLCLEPSCPNPATWRGRCQSHARKQDRNTQRAGYHIYRTKRWRNTRRAYLHDHPLCQCGKIATDVHHITDIADGGDPWHPNNLQALCHPCHSQTTRTRQTTFASSSSNAAYATPASGPSDTT
jgi:5-methylcytosine-specific restriction enzyme A